MSRQPSVLFALLCLAPLAAPAVEHPFMLWTREEAAALRERIAADADARAQLTRMEGSQIAKGNRCLWNLFRYLVLEDQEAGEMELRRLRYFRDAKPEPMTWNVDLDKIRWNYGNSSRGDAHMRDEQTLNVLRYDVLYDLLTDRDKEGVRASFNHYIDFHLSGHPPTHPAFSYSRTGWLPNMHWPRAIGTHLMAVALRDEDRIRQMFAGPGGWQWFMDAYLADGRFYLEEFGKIYSNIGSMLMYCEALEKLGLGRYGYGYTGTGGASMERFLLSLFDLGLPRLAPRPEATPGYPRVTMGDAGRLHWLIIPAGPGGVGKRGVSGNFWWSDAHMNGSLPKLRLPGWFEIGHRRWPDAGYDYFLAQLRQPGEERYLPSLYWGLGSIDPATVAPPPAPSYVTRERGFAMLRMEEGSGYWEGPRPVAVQQFGMYYVHYVHDCFSLLQYQAHHRMLYCGMGREPKGRGYGGNDKWYDHARGHNTVCVDGLQGRPVDDGNAGCASQRIRDHLAGPARFVAVRADGIFPGVTQERLLVLTDEYLLDVFDLASAKEAERVYDWQVLSEALPDGATVASWEALETDPGRVFLRAPRRLAADDAPWSLALTLPDVGASAGVGVRVRMLPAPGTTVQVATPPQIAVGGGTSLLVSRRVQATTFTALHEPFAGGAATLPERRFEPLGSPTPGTMALRITGGCCDDRVLIAYGAEVAAPRTVTAGDESYTFTSYAFLRLSAERVEAAGDLQACRLPVTGAPALTLDGAPVEAAVADGVLGWERR